MFSQETAFWFKVCNAVYESESLGVESEDVIHIPLSCCAVFAVCSGRVRSMWCPCGQQRHNYQQNATYANSTIYHLSVNKIPNYKKKYIFVEAFLQSEVQNIY